MNKRIGILAILCVVIVGSSSTNIASAVYNLEWGFEVGDQFQFRRSGTPFIPVVDYYVEIDALPSNLTDSNFFASDGYMNYYTFYDTNGTELEYPEVFIALPIGNWSFIQETWNETFQNFEGYELFEWVDTEAEWGFEITLNVSSMVATITVKFSKVDGVLNLMKTVVDPDVGLTATVEIARQYPQWFSLLSPEIMIGIGVGVVA